MPCVDTCKHTLSLTRTRSWIPRCPSHCPLTAPRWHIERACSPVNGGPPAARSLPPAPFMGSLCWSDTEKPPQPRQTQTPILHFNSTGLLWPPNGVLISPCWLVTRRRPRRSPCWPGSAHASQVDAGREGSGPTSKVLLRPTSCESVTGRGRRAFPTPPFDQQFTFPGLGPFPQWSVNS